MHLKFTSYFHLVCQLFPNASAVLDVLSADDTYIDDRLKHLSSFISQGISSLI